MTLRAIDLEDHTSLILAAHSTDSTYCYTSGEKRLIQLEEKAKTIQKMDISRIDSHNVITALVAKKLTECHVLFIQCEEKKLTVMMYVSKPTFLEMNPNKMAMFSQMPGKTSPYKDFKVAYPDKEAFSNLLFDENDSVKVIVAGKNSNQYNEKIKDQLGCKIESIKNIDLPGELKIDDSALSTETRIVFKELVTAKKVKQQRTYCSIGYLVEKDLFVITGQDEQGKRIIMTATKAFENIESLTLRKKTDKYAEFIETQKKIAESRYYETVIWALTLED